MSLNILVPPLGESVLEATVGRWFKQEGDPVSAGEPLVELETDKVNLEVGAEQGGVLARIERQAGEDVRVGDVLGSIDAGASPAAAPEPQAAAPAAAAEPAAGPPEPSPAPAATPVARRMGAALGLDLARVPGSGPGGRVTKADLQTLAAGPAGAPPQAQAAEAAPAVPERREERVPMSRRRRTIARRLVEAQQTAAMLTTFNEIDMDAVVALRRRHKDDFSLRHGVGLGYTSFFVKACVLALRDFPRLNAEIQGGEMVLKRYYDIGIAVGAEEGLVVPVLRDADRLSFAAIELAVKGFVEKAQQGALTLDDLRGGTFSITNGGVFGSLLSTPILNPPQVGILGMHKIEERPVARAGTVVIRPMMYVALTYDHRIVDGREAVQFLVRVKELIEDPEGMLLEG